MADVGVSGWTLRLEVTSTSPVPAADVQSVVQDVVTLLEEGKGGALDAALDMIRRGEIHEPVKPVDF